MTAREMQAIADIIAAEVRAHGESPATGRLTVALAHYMHAANPRFDPSRFYRAAGVGTGGTP